MPDSDDGARIRSAMWGARWVFALSVASAAFAYGVNIAVGRMGPELLGFYGFLTLTNAVISTFFLFGGANVIINFVPRIRGGREKDFVVTYVLIAVAFGVTLLALCFIFPQILAWMYGKSVDSSVLLYVSCLFLLVVGQVLVWSILQSVMKFRPYAISQYSVPMLTLSMMGLIAAGEKVFRGNVVWGFHSIFVAVACSNLIALCFGVVFVFKQVIGKWTPLSGLHIPSGFWRFAVTLHINSLLLFFLTNTDQLIVLRSLGLREMGYYRVVMVISALVIWVPVVMDKTYYATFCNLTGKSLDTKEVFSRFARINILTCSFAFLGLILFSDVFTSLFGKSASSQDAPVLFLLCAAKLLTAPINMLNLALLTAHQKTFHTMMYYVFGAILSLWLFNLLIASQGLLGAGIAFLTVQILIFGVSIGLTKAVTGVTFPFKKFLVSVLAVATGLVGILWFEHTNALTFAVKLGLFTGFVLLVLGTRLVTREDMQEVATWFLPASVVRLIPLGYK